MRAISVLVSGLLLLVVSSFVSSPHSEEGAARQYVSNFENVLGTSLELKITSTSAQESEKAEVAALHEINRIEKILSGYDTSSEFSRWMKTKYEAVPVSQELFEVLDLFDQWRTKTNGALDASAEIVSRVWKTAAKNQQLPTQVELDQAAARVKQIHWKLDHKNRTATHVSSAPLLLNSFAKSYIINKATDAAMAGADVKAMVMNIGGDLVIQGDLTESVFITDPRANAENDEPLERIKVANKAVATSGNYKRGVKIGDHWYSHIVDPRTGKPVDHVISATVVADDATEAGALATAFNVLSTDESKLLASTLSGVEYLLITREGERIESNGWKYLEDVQENNQKGIIESFTSPTDWDTNYELVVNFEIKRQQGYAPRPFVAVWIENAKREPVRNLAIWFGRQRWLPDLRSWYRMNYAKAEKAADNSAIVSVASATRPPGLYTLKWDGKDDDGKLVEAGKYIIYIEAAREQGTYQIIKQEMEFTGVPKQIDLYGNPEIASASLDYHKKP